MNAIVEQTNLDVLSEAFSLLSATLDCTGYIAVRGFGVGAAKDRQARQKFFAPGDYQGACAEAERLSNAGYDAYFATCTFMSNKAADAANVHAVKCFKIDLDVEEGNEAKYGSKREAVETLVNFCDGDNLPVPVLVDSGYGVHGYWILSESLDAGDGKLYSEKLKALLIARGLKHDRTVTGDVVRVLRVPGTLNSKQAVARRVKLKSPVTTVDTDTMLDKIDALYAATPDMPVREAKQDLMLGALPAHLRGRKLDKDTIGLITGKPKSFAVMVKRMNAGDSKACAQIADIYNKQCKQAESRWRAGLSIAHFCDDGEWAIHEISNRYPNYDHDETTKKAALIKGPYKCQTFENSWPELCKNCPHKNVITSPIQLCEDDRPLPRFEMSLEAALDVARAVEKLTKDGDVGAVLEPDAVVALQAIKKHDPAEFQRVRASLKAANRKLSIAALDEAIRGDAKNTERTIADLLVKLACNECTFLHDADDESYATFLRDGHRECWKLESKGFREWLSYQFFREHKTAPTDVSMTAAISTLSGQAKFDGEERLFAVRVAKHDDDYFIDLCNEQWQAARITRSGWQVVDAPPVMFTRTSTMRALPTPTTGGSLGDLWKLANIGVEDRELLLAWMIEAFRPDTPYPVLELFAEQGAAKSSTQSVIRELIDPNRANLRAKPKTIEDLFITAKASHVTSLENLSYLSPDFQDALCALATGAGYGGRTLYTNSEETVFDLKRPVMLNGISVVATRQDLMDRTLLIDLPPLVFRRAEADIDAEFQQTKSRIFGALLSLFSASLAVLPSVQIAHGNLPRMADFARLGEAVFRALGRPNGEFLKKYHAKRQQGVAHTIESSPIAAAVIAWLERNPAGFSGPLKSLYDALTPFRSIGEQWPTSLRGFGDGLRRVVPSLRILGYDVQYLGHHRDGHRWQIKSDICPPA
ncbi:MAG TPA: hypothetical protein VJ698_02460 [Noviherbaspirillum sp.]|uniref:hypothetical protein n=1 Tax=Noviherbaspirillum sp. TaxID=1926288 RepID=UPI002B45CA56|nr:hypothetical protein [Noviherbaspirillum sp.]HJV84311.1 hypothetical protein [Noviherbaspirillum sp.]